MWGRTEALSQPGWILASLVTFSDKLGPFRKFSKPQCPEGCEDYVRSSTCGASSGPGTRKSSMRGSDYCSPGARPPDASLHPFPCPPWSLSLPSALPPVPTSTHRALAPSTATFSPAVSSCVPVENPNIRGLNFLRMSFKREKADSTGEWEMDMQCWGTGGGRDSFGSFRGWLTSLLADNLLCRVSEGRPWSPRGAVVAAVTVLLRGATYWAVWCGSPRPRPLQRWGRETHLFKSPDLLLMLLSQNQRVHPWWGIPITLRTDVSTKASSQS